MLRILLVEDDNDLNSLIATYLKEAGYEVVTTFNGLDALKEFHESKFDLILSDIMMPLCDGYELARQVRVTNNQVPLVFMSARDDKPSKQLGYKTGIDDYITKPFDIEELVMKINAIFRRLNIANTNILEVGNFKMDKEEHMAYIDEEELPDFLQGEDVVTIKAD